MNTQPFNPSQGVVLQDEELVDWLMKRLGDKVEVWTARGVGAFLSAEMLRELMLCYQSLDSSVKLKIVMGYLYLSPQKNMNWTEDMYNLLNVANRDPDDWVELIADMLRKVSPNGVLELEPANNRYHFMETKGIMTRWLINLVDRHPDWEPLPRSHWYCEHRVIQDEFGFTEPTMQNHFTIKKKTKAEYLKEEGMKFVENFDAIKEAQEKGIVTSNLPIKIRSTLRRGDFSQPMRAIVQPSAVKMSGGFTNEPKKVFTRPTPKREGGAKLIAIIDIPHSMKKKNGPMSEDEKRRKKEELEAAKKKAMEEKVEARRLASQKAAEERKEQERLRQEKIKSAKLEAEREAERKKAAKLEEEAETMRKKKEAEELERRREADRLEAENAVRGLEDSIREPFAQPGPSMNQAELANGFNRQNAGYMNKIRSAPSVQSQAKKWEKPKISDNQRSAILKNCQMILNSSNRLDLGAQEHIISFLAGSKDKRPEGSDVITVKLSDTIEEGNADGRACMLRIEILFQMDYRSMEWKRLRQCKMMDADELKDFNKDQRKSYLKMTNEQIEHCIVEYAQQAEEGGEDAMETGIELDGRQFVPMQNIPNMTMRTGPPIGNAVPAGQPPGKLMRLPNGQMVRYVTAAEAAQLNLKKASPLPSPMAPGPFQMPFQVGNNDYNYHDDSLQQSNGNPTSKNDSGQEMTAGQAIAQRLGLSQRRGPSYQPHFGQAQPFQNQSNSSPLSSPTLASPPPMQRAQVQPEQPTMQQPTYQPSQPSNPMPHIRTMQQPIYIQQHQQNSAVQQQQPIRPAPIVTPETQQLLQRQQQLQQQQQQQQQNAEMQRQITMQAQQAVQKQDQQHRLLQQQLLQQDGRRQQLLQEQQQRQQDAVRLQFAQQQQNLQIQAQQLLQIRQPQGQQPFQTLQQMFQQSQQGMQQNAQQSLQQQQLNNQAMQAFGQNGQWQ